MPKTLDEIERDIRQLSPEQLSEFRAWFEEFDAAAWDGQIEQDASNGKLDTLACAALAEHKIGRSKSL